MILRHRFPLMMLSAPIKTGIQMPLPIALGSYRDPYRTRVVSIRNRRKTAAMKTTATKPGTLAARLMRFLGSRKMARTKSSPKMAAAIRRAQSMTAITPQEYLF
jgi:hypothetical protein